MEEKDLEEVSEAISNNISGEIIEAKKQAKSLKIWALS